MWIARITDAGKKNAFEVRQPASKVYGFALFNYDR
jgi:hypothetical protein